ncbi:MAG: BolA family transcriptional regulator [Alphaproteobacteria bacterium]|nr:BolA family transcriptional regulator [Alphaproteobacteria bacterium]
MDPDDIRAILEEALPDCTAMINDDAGDGEHFSAEVVSPAFEGLPLVRQHKLVYEALGPRVGTDIHALALRTFTPARWKARTP